MTLKSQNQGRARICALGSYLPERVLTNSDLEKMVETSDEWIVSRTGIKERRIAAENEFTSDLGFKAAQKALGDFPVESIDMILVATMTPDYLSPSTAAIIQAKLGAVKAAAMDVQAACTGFLYALSIAKAFVESKMYKNVLVIAAEKMSSVMDYQDRNTCVLFGDGAAAALVAAEGVGYSIDTICLGADGELDQLIMIPAGGSRIPTSPTTIEQRMHYMKMTGREVFKHAVRRMGAAITDCLDKASLKDTDISWLVPHQANSRIIETIAKNVNLSMEKVHQTLHKYGNTSGSSIAIALDELIKTEKIIEGEHLLLVAFGAGLTWGAAILTHTSK